MRAAQIALFSLSPSLSVSNTPLHHHTACSPLCILMNEAEADYKPGLSKWLLIFLSVASVYRHVNFMGTYSTIVVCVAFVVFPNAVWNTADRQSPSLLLMSAGWISSLVFNRTVRFSYVCASATRGGQCAICVETQSTQFVFQTSGRPTSNCICVQEVSRRATNVFDSTSFKSHIISRVYLHCISKQEAIMTLTAAHRHSEWFVYMKADGNRRQIQQQLAQYHTSVINIDMHCFFNIIKQLNTFIWHPD